MNPALDMFVDAGTSRCSRYWDDHTDVAGLGLAGLGWAGLVQPAVSPHWQGGVVCHDRMVPISHSSTCLETCAPLGQLIMQHIIIHGLVYRLIIHGLVPG